MSLYRLLPKAGLLAVVLWGCPAVGATAEIERGLPPDASAVLTVNLKQLLHAPVIKEHGLSSLRQALKNTEAVHAVLTAFGLDPLRDLDRLTIAMVPEGEKSDTVAILRGRFDTARFHLAARQLVKEYGDRLSIHTNDGLKYYRLDSSGEHGSIVFGASSSSKKGTALSVQTKGCLLDAFGGTCVTLADKNTLIVASSEKLLKGACDRIAGKGASLNKPMRRLLEELDGKQTILFALRPTGPAPDTSEAADSGLEQLKPPPFPLPPALFPERQRLFPESQKTSDRLKLQQDWEQVWRQLCFPELQKETEPSLPPPPPAPLSHEARKATRQSSPYELSGAIALADDFKLRCTVRTSNSADAKAVMKGFDELRLRMDGLATLLAGSDKDCAFLKELPKSFLAVRKGRIILIEGRLSAETLGKLLGTKVTVKTQ